METGRPPFIFFQPKILFLSQALVSNQQGESMRQYLNDIKNVPGKKVYRLVIDQCSMTDDVFANILDGIISQCISDRDTGIIRIQYLRSIVYSNNSIGYKSMLRLKQLIPSLCDLILNNIHFLGDRDQHGRDFSSKDIFYEILQSIGTKSSKLMKLKLTNMSLNQSNSQLLNRVTHVINISKLMIFLDLSWAKLLPKDLA